MGFRIGISMIRSMTYQKTYHKRISMKKEWQQNMDPANNQHQLKQTTCNENQKHCHVGQKDGWLDVASSNLSMLLLPVNCV